MITSSFGLKDNQERSRSWAFHRCENSRQRGFYWLELEHEQGNLAALITQSCGMTGPSDEFSDFLHAVVTEPSLQEELRD